MTTVPFIPDNTETKPPYQSPYDTISHVREFMLTAGQEVLPSPGQPNADVLKLRLALELEELYEKAQAMGLEASFCTMLGEAFHRGSGYHGVGDNAKIAVDTNVYDPVSLLDACLDQRYVQDGTVLACGLQDAFPEGFADVHGSNMSKFPASYHEAAATVARSEKFGIKAEFAHPHPWQGYYVVRRVSDGKILKSISYRPANLAPILEKYTQTSPSSGENV